jgi:hypothetical protein
MQSCMHEAADGVLVVVDQGLLVVLLISIADWACIVDHRVTCGVTVSLCLTWFRLLRLLRQSASRGPDLKTTQQHTNYRAQVKLVN